MISIGVRRWCCTDATDRWSNGQRSSVYAQMTTDTVKGVRSVDGC